MSSDAAPSHPSTVSATRKTDVSQRSYSTPVMLTFAALAIVGIFAHTVFSSARPETPLTAPRWSPAPEPVVEPEPVEPLEAVPPSPPVRIRNAFDESEVFEFPAGTSKEEARQAVAEILKRRALERQ